MSDTDRQYDRARTVHAWGDVAISLGFGIPIIAIVGLTVVSPVVGIIPLLTLVPVLRVGMRGVGACWDVAAAPDIPRDQQYFANLPPAELALVFVDPYAKKN